MSYTFEKQLQEELALESSLLESYSYALQPLSSFNEQNLLIHHAPTGVYFSSYKPPRKPKGDRYIGKQNHPDVQAIQQRYYYEHVIANLESNLKELRRLDSRYKPIDPNKLRESFPKAYQFDAPQIFELAGTIDERAWAEAAERSTYKASGSHPEHLTQMAADGHYVRSKSEVIITNTLYAHKLPIRHEEERLFGDMVIAPDFTIYSEKLHREIIWEHFGLMNSARYRNTYQRKMAAFAEAGFLPYINLITTFDDTDGNIDSRLIEQLVETYFL